MDNGFVVYRNQVAPFSKYQGIGTKKAWPLWLESDEMSVQLTSIADNNWFNYQDVIIRTVPNPDFISEYIIQCDKIRIPISVFYLSNEAIHFSQESLHLGYDCLGTTDYSYLYEDDAFALFKEELSRYGICSNKYGLFRSYADCEKYIEIRTRAIAQGLNLEDAWPYTIVCIEKVNILKAKRI